MRPFLLELSFPSCHLTSKKAPVTGTESLRWLSQAKPVTPVECGDDPLKGSVLFWSSLSPGDIRNYRLQLCFLSPLSATGMMASIPFYSPLGSLLESLQPLHPAPDLKGPKLACLCNKIWPQYALDNQSKGPPNVTLEPTIIWNLYKYCE